MEAEAAIRSDGLTVPHPSRFAPGRDDYGDCIAAHDRAVADGADGYIDPVTGLFVMTAVNLANQGRCCDRGCRHCPFLGATVEAGGASPIQENEDRT